MPRLPAHPNLEQLHHQAKESLPPANAGEPDAVDAGAATDEIDPSPDNPKPPSPEVAALLVPASIINPTASLG